MEKGTLDNMFGKQSDKRPPGWSTQSTVHIDVSDSPDDADVAKQPRAEKKTVRAKSAPKQKMATPRTPIAESVLKPPDGTPRAKSPARSNSNNVMMSQGSTDSLDNADNSSKLARWLTQLIETDGPPSKMVGDAIAEGLGKRQPSFAALQAFPPCRTGSNTALPAPFDPTGPGGMRVDLRKTGRACLSDRG